MKRMTGLLLSLLFAVAPLVQAGTYTVTSNSDTGSGSLRAAIAAATSGSDTIMFNGDMTITLASTLTLGNDVTIDAGGQHVVVDGGNSVGVFHVTSGATVQMTHLVIQHGLITRTTSADNGGGGIFNEGDLRLEQCLVTGNVVRGEDGGDGAGDKSGPWFGADGASGAGAEGGGVSNTGTLVLVDSSVVNNRALGGAGGDGDNGLQPPSSSQHDGFGGWGGNGGSGGYANGGGLLNVGTLTLIDSNVTNNRATGGPAGNGGDGADGFSPSAQDQHDGGGFGGFGGNGGYSKGGGIFSASPQDLTVTRSTVSGNKVQGGAAGDGGLGGDGGNGSAGISGSPGGHAGADGGFGRTGGNGGDGNGGGIFVGSPLVATNSTFSNNMASGGAAGNGGAGGDGGVGGAGAPGASGINGGDGGDGGDGGGGGDSGDGGNGGSGEGGGIFSAGPVSLTMAQTAAPAASTSSLLNVTMASNSTNPGAAGFPNAGGRGGDGGAGGAPAGSGSQAGMGGSAGSDGWDGQTQAPGHASGDDLSMYSPITLTNSIIADGCDGSITDNGGNMDVGTSCGFGGSSQSNITFNLGPLQDNGGATTTLLPGGAAIDAIDCTAAPTTDQRGIHRPQGSKCDVGAVEVAVIESLSVTVSGSGAVSANATPVPQAGGIAACTDAGGSNCNADYAQADAVTLNATPASGSHFVQWGGDCAGTANSTTVTMDADKTCTATFVINDYTVTGVVAGGQGTLTPASQGVAGGTVATLAATPDTGWHIDTISGCSGALSGSTYTTAPVTADCTVTVTFAINAYTVTGVVSGGHGSINPASTNANYGDTPSLALTPDSGYHVDTVTGCGGTRSGNTYTTAPVTADCTVTVAFAAGQVVTPPSSVPVPTLDWRGLLALMLLLVGGTYITLRRP